MLMILFGAAMAVVAYSAMMGISDAFDELLTDPIPEMRISAELQDRIAQVSIYLERFIEHREPAIYEDLTELGILISGSLRELGASQELQPAQRALLDSSRSQWQRFMTLLEEAGPAVTGGTGPSAEVDWQESRQIVHAVSQQTLRVNAHALAEIDELGDEVVAIREKTYLYISLVFLAGMGMALLIAYVLGRLIVGPIQRLAKGATQYAEGNLDYRIPPQPQHELGTLALLFNHMADSLQAVYRDLKELSIRDGLTGALNRREFRKRFLLELERGGRHHRPLSVIYLDLDFFKSINDNWGHAAGDQVLVAVSKRVMGLLRPSDVFSRLGGEEFAVLLPETRIDGAAEMAERLRCEIERMEIAVRDGVDLRVTASFGIAAAPEHGVSESGLLRAADGALYKAKQEGRNRVEVSAAIASPGEERESPDDRRTAHSG